MFRYYHTLNYASEIEKELARVHYLVQILIDEYDLFLLSKSLLHLLDREVNLEIVIISTTSKKSMKLVNLCKRLVDLGAQIYWKIDKDTFVKEDYYAIFDKQYLICARKHSDFDSAEALLRQKNDFFNSLCIPSSRLRLKSGEIEIQFAAASGIIYSNQDVVLNWDTKNAHEIEIQPEIGMVSASGSKRIKIKSNTQFKITAKNKDHSLKKSLFIRVIENKEIGFVIAAFDSIIKEYVQLSPSSFNESNYAVYFGQKIRIQWDIGMMGKLTEANLGNLPLQAEHEFEISKNKTFIFIFKTMNNSQVKKISFHCFEEEQLSDTKLIGAHKGHLNLLIKNLRRMLKKTVHLFSNNS